VAIDVVICKMLSVDPEMLYTQKAARAIGWGVPDFADIELKGAPLREVQVRDFKPARGGDVLARMPAFARRLLRRLLTFRPALVGNACKACGACAEVCRAGAIKLGKKVSIDYDKCIRCFCCQEICPHGALYVKEGLLVRLLRGGISGEKPAFPHIAGKTPPVGKT
jgi:ferredoxin